MVKGIVRQMLSAIDDWIWCEHCEDGLSHDTVDRRDHKMRQWCALSLAVWSRHKPHFFQDWFFLGLLQLRAQDMKIVCSYRFAKSGTQEGGLDFMRRQNTLLESGWHIQGAIKSSHQPLVGRFSKMSRILKCRNQKVSPIHDWSKEVRIKLLNQRVENIKKLTTLPQDEIKQSNMIDWSW